YLSEKGRHKAVRTSLFIPFPLRSKILASVCCPPKYCLTLKTLIMYLDNLQQDYIFVPSRMEAMEALTGIPPRRGMERAIISNGRIVNVVSKSYGHIPNELFFTKAEQLLVDSHLNYKKRTI